MISRLFVPTEEGTTFDFALLNLSDTEMGCTIILPLIPICASKHTLQNKPIKITMKLNLAYAHC